VTITFLDKEDKVVSKASKTPDLSSILDPDSRVSFASNWESASEDSIPASREVSFDSTGKPVEPVVRDNTNPKTTSSTKVTYLDPSTKEYVPKFRSSLDPNGRMTFSSKDGEEEEGAHSGTETTAHDSPSTDTSSSHDETNSTSNDSHTESHGTDSHSTMTEDGSTHGDTTSSHGTDSHSSSTDSHGDSTTSTSGESHSTSSGSHEDTTENHGDTSGGHADTNGGHGEDTSGGDHGEESGGHGEESGGGGHGEEASGAHCSRNRNWVSFGSS